MPEESEPLSRVRFSLVLIEVSDQLAAHFPEWPLATIHEVLEESREAAERELPNLTAYRYALEQPSGSGSAAAPGVLGACA